MEFLSARKLRAKRRVLEISNAKSMQDRTPLYRDLVNMAKETLEQVTVNALFA